MKRIITLLLIGILFLTSPVNSVMAEDVETCVNVTQYGGAVGVVCGAKHEPVGTGLADINPLLLSSLFFLVAGYGMYQYKKLQKTVISLN